MENSLLSIDRMAVAKMKNKELVSEIKTLWDIPQRLRLDVMKRMILKFSKPPLTENFTRKELSQLCKKYDCVFRYSDCPESFFCFEENPRAIEIGFSEDNLLRELVIHLSHELSHAIQYKFYGNFNHKKTLSAALGLEKEAEKLSYFVYKEYFQEIYPDLKPRHFRCYTTKHSKLWLLDFAGVKDDIGLTSRKNEVLDDN